MTGIYLSLGTNIEPRLEHLREAIRLLSIHEEITCVEQSTVYETDPVGYLDQADFLNIVIQLETTLSPIQLLDYCQEIEEKLGRERAIRFGPRTIDLDLLVYYDKVIHTERLIIPHPRMHERGFVLVPLQEMAAGLHIPKINQTVEALLDQMDASEKRQVRVWDEDKYS